MSETKICPKCGAKLRKCKGNKSMFWGCSNYPNCKHYEFIEWIEEFDLILEEEEYQELRRWKNSLNKRELSHNEEGRIKEEKFLQENPWWDKVHKY